MTRSSLERIGTGALPTNVARSAGRAALFEWAEGGSHHECPNPAMGDCLQHGAHNNAMVLDF